MKTQEHEALKRRLEIADELKRKQTELEVGVALLENEHNWKQVLIQFRNNGSGSWVKLDGLDLIPDDSLRQFLLRSMKDSMVLLRKDYNTL